MRLRTLSMIPMILRTLFVIFVISWTCFWLKNRYVDFSSHLEETKKLCGKSFQKKWEYIFGDDLYQLLCASQRLIPPYEKLFVVWTVDRFQTMMANYFLHPRLITGEAEANFVIVYKQPFSRGSDSEVLYTGGPGIFILKK